MDNIQMNVNQNFKDVIADILDYMRTGETDRCDLEMTIGSNKLILEITVRVEEGNND